MSDATPQQEPSMEEILASIRRIISEDDREDDAPGDDAPAESAPPDSATEETAVAEEPSNDDDVLELTDEIGDDDDTVVSLPTATSVDEFESTDDDVAEAEAEVDVPVVIEVERDDAGLAENDGDGLISPPAASDSTNQFAALAAAVAGQQSVMSMGVGNRTIEDLVKEVMRPMIKEWLDANLPSLVERLVGREIDRMSRRAEDDVDQ